MQNEKPDLTLVFRDKRNGTHSIERLFAVLEPHFSARYNVHKVIVPRQPSGLLALWANIRHVRKHARGIVHVTGDAQYLIPFLPKGRRILTIHDCGNLLELKGWKKLLYKWIWFILPCRFATAITVISESTRIILEREVGAMGSKLSVIENCITLKIQSTSRAFNATCPRILQIGSGRHKNLDTLIKAVDGLKCELHIVGRLSDEDRHELEKRKIFYQNEFSVSDGRINEIFQECDILFFASRHEGFGLPILEAQAAGVPVITSNCYSMPWVAGEGAVIVNPESSSEIQKGINTILEDHDFRRNLIRSGFENVRRFTPESCSENYMDLYKSVTAEDS